MKAARAGSPEGPHAKEPRRLPGGAEVLLDGGVHFRVWASKRHRVEVVLESGSESTFVSAPIVIALDPEGDGWLLLQDCR